MRTKIILVSAALAGAMALPAFAQDSMTTTTVTKDGTHAGAGAGIVGGAATGALVGGPIGAVIGAGVGAAAGSTLDPPAKVKTYVETTKVDPVTYGGPMTIGAVVPDNTVVYAVPDDPRYRWTYINHQRILIDGNTHQIISVLNDDQ